MFIPELISSSCVLAIQDNADYNLSSIVKKIVMRYGGLELFRQNVIERTLQLLVCVFRRISFADLPVEMIFEFWNSIIYVLDSIVGTYTDSNPNKSADVPPYTEYYDELKRTREVSSEEETASLVNMVQTITFLFSYFFELPLIHTELQRPYMKDSIQCLLDLYSDDSCILGMFFYNYGRAVVSSMQFNDPLNTTPLSYMVADFIFENLNMYYNVDS